jgi:hypothetical protein
MNARYCKIESHVVPAAVNRGNFARFDFHAYASAAALIDVLVELYGSNAHAPLDGNVCCKR